MTSPDPRTVLARLVELYDEDDGFCCSSHVREAMAAARAVLAEPEEVETRTEWQVLFKDNDPLFTDKWPWVQAWITHSPQRFLHLWQREITTSTTLWVEVPGPAVQGGRESDG